MGDKRNNKDLINQEKVFRAIALTPGHLDTIKERMRKNKVLESRTKITNSINELIKEGRLLLKNNYISVNPNMVTHGKLVVTNNRSYLLIDGDTHQYYIDRKDCEGIRPNSRVEIAFYNKLSKGKIESVPFVVKEEKIEAKQEDTKISKPYEKTGEDNFETIYGRVMKSSHDELIFLPNDKKRFKKPIIISNDRKTLSKYQDKICTMKILSSETEENQAIGVLQDIKGEAGNPIAEYDAIAQSHGAIMSFSDEAVKKELENIPDEVDLSKYSLKNINDNAENTHKPKIIDLRELNFTTTDPATCKDMDDAIYSTFDKDGKLIVYVAVANVTKYVNLNSEIGRRYIQAGFTTYAPNKAYNILPPQLSTNICSLNPNVDRLAFVVKTVVDPKSGKPLQSSIYDGVIRSREKFSYEQAQKIVDENNIPLSSIFIKSKQGQELSREEQVIMNKIASDVLWKGFKSRELIEFDSDNEYDIKFNEDMSDIVDIEKTPHLDYHKVIEAFMLTANEATAEYALNNKIPNIYRVHEEPDESKLSQAFEFFNYLNIPFEGDLSPSAIRNIVYSVRGTEKEKVVNNFLVRMQSKAKYCNTTNPEDVKLIGKPTRKPVIAKKSQASEGQVEFIREKEESSSRQMINNALKSLDKNISHFGLQSEHYSHTTSPIRRITDYVTQYNILAHINGGKMFDEQNVRDIALWANQMEEAVELSEKQFSELNSALYCLHHLNEPMKGRISYFKKLIDKSDVSIDEIVVVVENEDKGIKVELPLSDVLATKGINSKKVAISQYGSAVINKITQSPLLTVCQELIFQVLESDKITRQIKGSTNLALKKSCINLSERENINLIEKYFNNTNISAKKEKMLKNKEFCKQHRNEIDKNEAEKMKYGYKFKNQIKYDDFASEMGNNEAFYANKYSSQKHKRNKMNEALKTDLEYFHSLENSIEENKTLEKIDENLQYNEEDLER